MSAQDVSKFEEKVRTDPQLLAELQSLRSVADERALPQKIAEVARKHGFSISANEVDDYLKGLASRSALSDEALNGVAGGDFLRSQVRVPSRAAVGGELARPQRVTQPVVAGERGTGPGLSCMGVTSGHLNLECPLHVSDSNV